MGLTFNKYKMFDIIRFTLLIINPLAFSIHFTVSGDEEILIKKIKTYCLKILSKHKTVAVQCKCEPSN